MDGTYENVLRATDISDLVGEFSCTVSNVRGSASRSITLNGITIEGDDSLPFTVGNAASIRCVSESPATMIQWLDPSGVEVAMTTTVQTLDLPFTPVSDSLHNSVYTCRVTRAEGTGEQTVTLTVTVPPNSISVTVSSPSSPVAGMDYTLRCEVTRRVSGLTHTPTAVWETNSGEEIVSGGDVLDLPFTSIRTSEGGRYVCKGSLTSPALAVPQEDMDSAVLVVQIPTPGVTIDQPPSPLYAGTSLSLTCTITVNPALDTTVSVAVTWERTRGTGPVTITTGVSTMGSRPIFSSTVTGITLSTLDTGFTCRAVVDPQAASVISSSPEGMNTQPIVILTPPQPVLSIEDSESPVAGSVYGLNCTATNVPGPLTSLLTMVWRRASGASETTLGVYFPLEFSPLRTSDGGVYTCQAEFDIPEADLPDLSNSMATTVNVQIPQPAISITGSPSDDGFSTGLELDLICEVELDAAVDSGLVVTRTWTKDGSPLSPEGSRLTLTEPTKVRMSPQVYQTNVSFNTLNARAGDRGRYVCSVRIEPQDTTYIDGTTADIIRDIAIEDFPVQQIDLPGDVTALAGAEHTLVCTATKNASLSTAVLEVEWLGPNGPLVNGQDDITIAGEPSTMDNTLTSSLTFTNLVTSQGGMYTCSVNLTISEANVTEHNVRRKSSVKIQIPPPLSVSVTPERPVPHYEGTSLDLTCTITLNTTGVDTAVVVERQFTGTTSSVDSRVTLSPLETVQGDFITTLTFNPVGSTDGGLYTCSVTVSSDLSAPNSQYISTSESTEGPYNLAITALPVPTVTITPSSLMITSGQSSTLTCTVAVVEYLVVVPAVQWMDSNGQEVGGVLNTIGTVTTSVLGFTGLATSQAGPYSCRGSINVPSVVDRDSSDQIVVTAHIPPPEVSITSSDQTAYHGTVHTLTCTIIIDPSVNTTVNVLVAWSIGGTPILDSDSYSITQPTLVSGSTYTADLTFTPLDQPAVSSGDYTCGVTVQPVDTTYIRQAIGSSDLILEVLAAPPPVVTTDVPNRDVPCDGVTTFTCSGSVVDNFAVSPEVTWQGPSNQNVGNQGVLSVQNGGNRIAEGMYTCMACVNVPSVGISNLCSTSTIQIRYTAPGPVLGLTCPSLVSTNTLNITWSPPTDGGDVIVGYQVEVTRYVPGEGRQVTTVDLTEPFNKEITPSSTVVTGLASTIRYLISVMGVSASGCGSKVTVECYTEEGVPPMIQDVKVVRLSDTEMNVSWVPLSIVEAKGFLGNYSITYSRVGGARRKRQAETVVEVSPDQSNEVIGGLEAGANYGVTVAARNLKTGMTSPSSSVVQSGIPQTTLFQLRLTNINNCPEWVDQNGRISAVTEALVLELESFCQCGFTSMNIKEPSFQCFSGSSEAATYRAEINGRFIDTIAQWISEDGIIRVQMVLIRVDSSCQVAITSLGDPECIVSPGGNPAVVGGVVGAIIAVLIIAIAVVVIVIAALVLNSRRAKLTLQRDPKRGFSPITLHGMTSTGQIQHYEMVELGGHEYEDVTKYQQEGAEYEVITPDPLHTKHTHPPPLPSQAVETSPPPLAVSPLPPTPVAQPPPTSPVTPASQPEVQGSQGDYEFAECVAYKTTSHVRAPPTATPTDLVYSNSNI